MRPIQIRILHISQGNFAIKIFCVENVEMQLGIRNSLLKKKLFRKKYILPKRYKVKGKSKSEVDIFRFQYPSLIV